MTDRKYSGYRRRFVAYCIDFIVMNLMIALFYSLAFDADITELIEVKLDALYRLNVWPLEMTMVQLYYLLFQEIWLPVSSVILFTVLEWTCGCTLGKCVMGIRVRNLAGVRPGFIRCFIRNIYKIFVDGCAVFLSCMLGVEKNTPAVIVISVAYAALFYLFLLANINKEKQGLHDRIAGTIVVIRNKSTNVPPITQTPPIMQTPPVTQTPPIMQTPPVTQAPPVTQVPPVTPTPQVTQMLLYCQNGLYRGETWNLDKPLTFGRDADTCDIVFTSDAAGISRRHCMLQVENSGVMLYDTGASYGTKVNDHLTLQNGNLIRLQEGDSFSIGKEEQFMIIRSEEA